MTKEEHIEIAAATAHEVNRAYCAGLGDHSQPSWADAPAWQRESAIAGVRAILENPDLTPEQSHEGWLEMKRGGGWVYGPAKDAEKKTHPCMVPFHHLPLAQQVKDTLFGVVVRGILAMGLPPPV